MGQSCRKNGRYKKTGKEIRCPESGGKKEARETGNVMGGLHQDRSGKSGNWTLSIVT